MTNTAVTYNQSTKIANDFFYNRLTSSDLAEINLLGIKKINLIENAEIEDIVLPSYRMLSIIVYTFTSTGHVYRWIIDIALAKLQGRTPESLIHEVVMHGTVKMLVITKSATRRDDTRMTLVTFNKF